MEVMVLGKVIRSVRKIINDISFIKTELDVVKRLVGSVASINIRSASSIAEAEFKVYSQWGDDGIIQYLIHNIEISRKVFVEFGVEDYLESTTRFLMVNSNWSGLVLDSDSVNIRAIKSQDIYWKYNIKARKSFVTADNINQILEDEGINGDIGMLHIDIDGNEYWIWKAIKCISPDIVAIEYNSVFGSDRSITIPYKPDFVRSKAHHSNLYAGASLRALSDLAEEKGYSFVGSNMAGNNAYFVKSDKIGTIKKISVEEGYKKSNFKESRDKDGQLNYLDFDRREKEIVGLSVFNTKTHNIENF